MLKVDLITVGKLKEDYLRRACEEYQKRLGAFVKLQIIELPEGKMPQDPSAAQIESCLAQEGQSILSKIPAQSFVVAMCIEGQMLSSEQLAETFLRQQTRRHQPDELYHRRLLGTGPCGQTAQQSQAVDVPHDLPASACPRHAA